MNSQKTNLVIVVQGQNFFKNEVEKIWSSYSIYFLKNYSGQVLYKFDYRANRSYFSDYNLIDQARNTSKGAKPI
ncbi:hypothetical protein L1276_000232 [Flavobacterium sp. HSC-32F16]|nr:hypothetical protein [Flavobacterium sp. HSC-32F16]